MEVLVLMYCIALDNAGVPNEVAGECIYFSVFPVPLPDWACSLYAQCFPAFFCYSKSP